MLRLADSWVWDSWYAFDGTRHHAFFLRASRALHDPHRRHRYPFVGHAVSDDLVEWRTVPDALAVSEPPAFDDATTWTGSVVRDEDGIWWMFYTGASRDDDALVQRVGAATSPDLMTWTKVSRKPIVEADPTWYELLDRSLWHDQAWRDPWVFRGDDGLWHMYVTARSPVGPVRDRGVVGHATSPDLRTWTVGPPVTDPGHGFGQMEVTQVEVIDGVPTLLWCCGTGELSDDAKRRHGKGGMFSASGASIHGPFDLANATRFPHDEIYAARAIQHEGSWYLLGFLGLDDATFRGEIADPLPITSTVGVGIHPR